MKRAGMSLVEVIVAASLVGLIFIFLLNVIPSAIMAVRQAEHRLAAQSQSQRVLDFCSSRGFEVLADGDYDSSSPGFFGATLARVVLDDQVELSTSVTIGAAGSVPRNRLARLQVTVSWIERERALSVVREYRVSSLRR